jgi:hypothetical protein
MSVRRFYKTRLAATGVTVLTVAVLGGAPAATAHPERGGYGGHGWGHGGHGGGHGGHGGGHGEQAPPQAAPSTPAPPAGPVYLVADLAGANEVAVPGGPAAGDQDGKGRVVVRIQGDQVCFTAQYAWIDAPTAGHIHAGAAGANGAVKVGFFGTALPASLHAVTGCVSQEAGAVAAIAADPGNHYVNLHTAAYPGGAVRGQLRRLDGAVDLLEPLRGDLVALMDGGQEVPALGDPDGRATGFLRARPHHVEFAFTWTGVAPPTAGHLHPGRPGEANPLAVELFAGGGLPPSLLGVAGAVGADRSVTKAVGRHPQDFYLNLHNGEYAKGAVRGQLFRP